MTAKVLCAVFDSAMKAFAPPFTVPTTAYAVRSFTDEVNRADPQNNMHNHPEDYSLYVLAMYHEEEGTFEPLKELLVRGKDVVRA